MSSGRWNGFVGSECSFREDANAKRYPRPVRQLPAVMPVAAAPAPELVLSATEAPAPVPDPLLDPTVDLDATIEVPQTFDEAPPPAPLETTDTVEMQALPPGAVAVDTGALPAIDSAAPEAEPALATARRKNGLRWWDGPAVNTARRLDPDD